MHQDVVTILQELVAIPSINPMGRVVEGSIFYETALTDHLERLLRGLDLAIWRQTVAPGRDNLVARLDGEVPPEEGGPLILFDAHQDTVPVDNMTIAPFAAEIRDGRLYGRGACDVKGGLAAMIAALGRLGAEPSRGRPTVVLCCTIDEEYQFMGIKALTSAGMGTRNGLIPRAPDAAIVAEPTGLDVVVAHKGIVRWRCHTTGRAVHSSKPDDGQSAIYAMAHILTALETYQRDVLPTLLVHPSLGGCTLNVGIIRGGSSINIVPDLCTIELEVRFPPGISVESGQGHVVDYLASAANSAFSARHDAPYMSGLALSDDANRTVAERIAKHSHEVHGSCQWRSVPYGTNASFFAAAGIPSVIFGPGSIEQAHTDNEWIAIDQLQESVEILVRFVKDWEK